MNKYIKELGEIAGKQTRTIVGLMSGTSLDGLDVALCYITGSGTATQLELKEFTTVPYTDGFRNEIRKIFAKTEIPFQHLCLLNPYIGRVYAQMILDCLESWKVAPADVDLIASHGQTVFHAPQKQHNLPNYPNATLQIGDGDHIAVKTGIITISDFRQKHVAAGGEGAPLAVYGDYLLFSKQDENRILLNMGGIANFTYLPGTLDATQVFTTDTGPGNTLIDAFSRRFFEKPYDEGGAIAASGHVSEDLLRFLKRNPFFEAPFPKTTGPEVFNLDFVRNAQQRSGTTSMTPEDLMATLTKFSADTIVDAIKKVIRPEEPYVMYASGGGAHNPVLMRHIREQLPNLPLHLTDELHIAGDAKEAVLFAVLANETVAGGNTDFGTREGVPSITMGKISFPG
ncbi:anhydro-N-acetylmuramic acid kinase [Telluribacter humicola]|uniref:anhydro-N-acetylmuramic acid kinase n=1 Tax=Telluribacter humicola TaxID=1720261 RepID=UPI001A974602|nr:anhydro-N-acetylmuramic acid kinase [Telluribacter humicola]